MSFRKLPSFRFTFLRAPSETLAFRRAFSSDLMADFSPHPEKDIIGVRGQEVAPFHIGKLSWRGNSVSGYIMRRPFFCSLEGPRSDSIWPVLVFRPHIKRRVAPGALLFAAFNRRIFNRTLRAVLSKIGEPQAGRCRPHAFRRGAPTNTRNPAPRPAVASSGVWNPHAFRGYVDFTRDAVRVGPSAL